MTVIDDRPRHLELGHLSQKNNNRKTVYKAKHHRMWDKPDKLPPLHNARENLQQAHQNNGGKQVLNTVLGNQCNHDNRQGARSTRNHTRATTDQRSDQAHDKGRIQSNKRVNTGHERKGHSLGDKGQSNGQTGQNFNANTPCVQRFVLHPTQIGHHKAVGKGGQNGFSHVRRSFTV